VSTVADTPAHGHAPAAAPATPRRLRPRLTPPAQRELILALLLLLCYGLFRQVPAWNEHSRYDLVVALVDDHTTRIDRYHENTGDKALYDGHYYSDKPPGTALLGAPVYAAMRGVSALAGAGRPDPGSVMPALAFAVAGIPTVLLALLLLRFLRPLVGEWWALTMTAGYALGSIAFPFATMYFGHAACAFFLFAAFYALWSARSGGSAWRPILAGFLAGWAVLVDLSAIPGVVALLAYALSRDRRGPLLMVAGALLPAALLLAYNWMSFGGPFALSYANLANSGFAAGMSQGILGVTLPKPAGLNEIALGPRGLLHLSPWLALAPLGLLAARQPGLRREIALCGAIALAYLLFNAGYYLPLGGWTPGPRFLMPALPFATVLVALAPRAFRPLIGLQIAFSIVLLFVATATMPNAPEAVRDPLGDLWLPRLLARDLADTTAWQRWGLHGIQPLLVLVLAAAIAAVACLATLQATPGARRPAAGGIALLAVLALGFGVPFGLIGARSPGTAMAAGNVDIAIVDAGVTEEPAESGVRKVVPWAQLENRGGAVERTMVIFEVYAPAGQRTWAAWHGDVRWQPRERKRLGVEWATKGTAPGEYRVSVAVMSADQQLTFARVENVALLRVTPERGKP
jgi:hypothetical protein